jgi:hypothetical protein
MARMMMWTAIVAALLFGYVAIHEWTYAIDHPNAYGPAKVIAVAGLAGVLLSIAVMIGSWSLHDAEEKEQRERLERLHRET